MSSSQPSTTAIDRAVRYLLDLLIKKGKVDPATYKVIKKGGKK